MRRDFKLRLISLSLSTSSWAEPKVRELRPDVPVIMITAYGDPQTRRSPNTVSYTWDTYSFANAQARIVKNLGLDTWYFVAVDYALGKSLVESASEAIERSGGKVVGTIDHPINTTDFSSFLLQAQSSKSK
jgi:ABC-type branched-subunit amino acid transport system substrate-binding protein